MRKLKAVPIGPCDVSLKPRSVPAFVRENIAQAAFIAISRAYQNPAIQEEYRQWKAERAGSGGGHV